VIVTAAIFRFGADVEGIGGRIDDGSGGDADFGNEVAGFTGVGVRDGGFTGKEHGGFPKLLTRTGVGVEGIDEVAFGGDKDDVVFLAVGHGEVGNIERLSVDVARNGAVFVDGAGEQEAKGG